MSSNAPPVPRRSCGGPPAPTRTSGSSNWSARCSPTRRTEGSLTPSSRSLWRSETGMVGSSSTPTGDGLTVRLRATVSASCEKDFQTASAGLTQFERVDGGGPGQASGMFVVVQGGDQFMELDDSSRGWRLRRHTDVSARVVQAQQSDAVGVDTFPSATDAEVFFSAAGRGSSGGSVAVGQPPCGGPEGSPVNTGAGTVQLFGGRKGRSSPARLPQAATRLPTSLVGRRSGALKVSPPGTLFSSARCAG